MALDFPASPTNGQLDSSGQWTYNSTKQAWQAVPLTAVKTATGPTPPSTPQNGDQWFNTTDGTLYIYYTDANSSQWVESRAPVTADGYISPNYVINGDFGINQRGFTSTTTGATFGFDRWTMESNLGTTTYSAQTFAAGTSPAYGFEASNYARLVASGHSGSGSYSFIHQPIENVRLLAGKTITISFYARSGSGTPSISIAIEQMFNLSSYVRNAVKKVSISTSWARYSATYTVPSTAGQTLLADNLTRTRVELWVSAGSSFDSVTGTLGIQSNTFDIWGVQVEEGTVATPFRRNSNSFQGELATCQRYYQKHGSSGLIVGGFGTFYTTNACRVFLYLPVEMRTAPAVGNAIFTGYTLDAIGTGDVTASVNNANYQASTKQVTWDFTGISPTRTFGQPVAYKGTVELVAEL